MIAHLRDVKFTYAHSPNPALDGINLDLHPGRLTGIIGASGSGKTTLCAVLRGLAPGFFPGELTGAVDVLGRPLAEWGDGDLSLRVGFAFQNPFVQLSGINETVFEEIAFGLENLGYERPRMIQRAIEVAEQVGITHLLDRDPRRLSGGQKQKVAFASVIAMDLETYIFDEPTSQLDPDSTAEIFAIIASLRDRGRSVVLVEHEIDLLAEHADDIVVLHAGQVAEQGPAADILSAPTLTNWGVTPPEVSVFATLLREQGLNVGRLTTAAPMVAALRSEGVADVA